MHSLSESESEIESEFVTLSEFVPGRPLFF